MSNYELSYKEWLKFRPGEDAATHNARISQGLKAENATRSKHLQTDSMFSNNPYGTAYSDNGVMKTSTFGTDQTMDMGQFNTWAENHPQAAADWGASGGTFDANNQQQSGLVNTVKPTSAIDMVNTGINGLQLGLGYLGYQEAKAANEEAVRINNENLALSKDQLYGKDAEGNYYTDTKDTRVSKSLGSAFA
jgi:hypothetical protein